MPNEFKAKAYLKSSCPFCFKFVMFMAEAALMDQIEIVCIDEADEEAMDRCRELLHRETGKPASFPTVEIAPGDYRGDSDGLIDLFASRNGVDPEDLPGLAYYKANLFPAYMARFKELQALRQKLA